MVGSKDVNLIVTRESLTIIFALVNFMAKEVIAIEWKEMTIA